MAEAQGSRTELRGNTPYTVTSFRVLEHVAGQKPGNLFEVSEAGGVVGEVGLAVSGVPAFEAGENYLLFLDAAPGGRWQTKMLAYGILREDKATGVMRPLPEASSLHVVSRPGVEKVGEYRKAELLQHLSAVSAGNPWHREAVAAPIMTPAAKSDAGLTVVGAELTAPPACRFVRAMDGLPLRWFGFETAATTVPVWHTTPGQVGIADGGVSAVQEAVTAWNNHGASTIRLNYAGSKGTSANCSDGDARDRNNEVIFNDPCNQVPDLIACTGTVPPGWTGNCCGQVAVYGTFFNGSQVRQHDGDNWRPIENLSIIVNNGSQCLGDADFKEMVTHFVGHGLGFDHHEDSNATMAGQLGVHASRGASIAATDRLCAAFSYHTFTDVSQPYWAWGNIEALDDGSLTTGCAPGQFCPLGMVRRDEIAAFIERGIHGPGYVPPPATGTVFGDVPADFWAAAYIEQMAAEGITTGCGNGNYCPFGPLLRDEMAIFLLRAKHGGSYVPPAATGTLFTDVPITHPAVAWIEQLFHEGITTGCEPNKYCPSNTVRRDEMAAFLVRTFQLPVPAN
ncbi:MAG TPA: S-layer homology domain-containing protein [Thermoanaerobaculia bacterium]|nr:S-layer homology domain-containing protein [Thermoanaerobaculia bacterium]